LINLDAFGLLSPITLVSNDPSVNNLVAANLEAMISEVSLDHLKELLDYTSLST
jgi:hypothetical protein